jgi:hypothetical protein
MGARWMHVVFTNLPKFIKLYNHLGQKVAPLAERNMSAGEHPARFDATRLAGGVYFYSLIAVDTEGKPVVLNGKLIIAR